MRKLKYASSVKSVRSRHIMKVPTSTAAGTQLQNPSALWCPSQPSRHTLLVMPSSLLELIYSPPRSDSELFSSPKSCNFLSFLTKNTSSIISRVLLLQVGVVFKLERCQACSFQSDLNSSSETTKKTEQR